MVDLKKAVGNMGIELNETQLSQFEQYYELLIEWNNKFNLTAITDHDEVMIKHFCDSLAIMKTGLLTDGVEIIDVGTGAGFPGIPIAIANPNVNITLLDSLNKRVGFLNTVKESLGLTNINAIHGRAEDFGRGELREKYDLCVSRAVANLSTLTELCSSFVKVGGYFVAYKSEKADEEINGAANAIKILGCDNIVKQDIEIPESDLSRSLLLIKKIKPTPSKYPRKAGTPSKQPL